MAFGQIVHIYTFISFSSNIFYNKDSNFIRAGQAAIIRNDVTLLLLVMTYAVTSRILMMRSVTPRVTSYLRLAATRARDTQ